MTISYNRLGSNGRLGNQMFQYAPCRGIAVYNGYDWMIPLMILIIGIIMVCLKPLKWFTASRNLGITNFPNVGESTHVTFDDKLYYTKDNVNIDAYLQCEDYFLHIVDHIHGFHL